MFYSAPKIRNLKKIACNKHCQKNIYLLRMKPKFFTLLTTFLIKKERYFPSSVKISLCTNTQISLYKCNKVFLGRSLQASYLLFTHGHKQWKKRLKIVRLPTRSTGPLWPEIQNFIHSFQNARLPNNFLNVVLVL